VFAHRPGEYLTVGETPGVSVELARDLTDPAARELDMVFQFEHMGLDHGRSKWDRHPVRLQDLKANLSKWQDGLADVGWNSLYWNNHDQPRIVSRYGDPAFRVASATALATVLHLQKGTPYVYQGEELGMANFPFTGIDQFRDVESLNHYREAVEDLGLPAEDALAGLRPVSRDNARTPMQWDDGPAAGFTTGTPWIAVNPDHTQVNAAAHRADPGSVFHYYRRLIALRHEDPLVQSGRYELLLADHPQIYAFTRTLGPRRLLVVANCSDEQVRCPLEMTGEVVIANHPQPQGVLLRPWEARVYREAG